jgi:hypothetical protein
MAVQFHVDMFHSIAGNETVKKIATLKARHNTNAKSPFIQKFLYTNISVIHGSEHIALQYRNETRKIRCAK